MTRSNSYPQFPRSPLVTPGTMTPFLARILARLTTYCAGLCFKSLASLEIFFMGNKFLLSTQKTRRKSQLLKTCVYVSLESSKHVGLVSDLKVRISSKPSLNSFLFDFVFTIHRKPAAISTLISRQQFRITYFHLTDELNPTGKTSQQNEKTCTSHYSQMFMLMTVL